MMNLLLRMGVIGVALAPWALAPAQAETPPDTLVMAREISGIACWDPAVSQILEVNEIDGDLYDRLVDYDPLKPGTELQPSLAESWDISEDGKTFTFKIRPGVHFYTSGREVTAQDVEYSFHRLLLLGKEPSTNMVQLGYTPENIKKLVRATDDRTFVMEFPEAFAPSFILNLLSSVNQSVIDREVLAENEKDGDFGSQWLCTHSAGSGPFMLKTWRANEIVILDRNDDYFAFTPSMRRVIFQHVPEAATQRLLLEKGDVDIAFNLTAADIEPLEKTDGIKVEINQARRILYFGFNTLVPPFDKPQVRQAMKYLIDYDGLEKTIMKNLGVVRQSFIPKGILGALEEKPFTYDVEKAKQLLKEAGLENGFSFKMLAYTRPPESELATAFQASAAKVGVKVEIVSMPGSQLVPAYRDRNLESLILAYSGSYGDPHATADKFTRNPASLPGQEKEEFPSQLAYRLGWQIPELTKMTDAAIRERDMEKRVEMYEEIQRRYWEDAPFAQMFANTFALGMRDGVNGYQVGTRGTDTSFAIVTKK